MRVMSFAPYHRSAGLVQGTWWSRGRVKKKPLLLSLILVWTIDAELVMTHGRSTQ